MKKIEIEVPEGKRAEWVNGVLTLVDEQPKNVMERIKTFADAVDALGEEHLFVKEHNNASAIGCSADLGAYIDLRIIVAALNEGWEPTFAEDEKRWYPWFRIMVGGVACACAGAVSDSLYTGSAYGSRLAFKSEELAEYAGKQFIDIYKAFLCGR